MSIEASGSTTAGAPPGGVWGGSARWRAVSRLLRSTGAVPVTSSNETPAAHSALPLRALHRAPHHVLRTTLSDLLTTVFPADCRACGLPLLGTGTLPVCSACIDSIHPSSGASAIRQPALCHRCGERLGMESERYATQFTERPHCGPCRMAPPQFVRATHYASYEGSLREMVHLLKYDRVRSVARVLGSMLANAIAQLAPELSGEIAIIAVPLFAAREHTRGYNQTTVLVDSALASLRKTHRHLDLQPRHDLLRRIRDTANQYGLTPHQRRQNLRGAFEAGDVAGKNILLIDDIYTTGATARECARVLRRAGAAQVWASTLARAQEDEIALWSGNSKTFQTVQRSN